MILHIKGGTIRTVYSDDLNLRALGGMTVQRASHVEPTEDGRWTVDLTPVGGPACLGVYGKRRDALAAEVAWLEEHL